MLIYRSWRILVRYHLLFLF